MPRNITVTFKDGSSHVYQNAPDDITPEAVQQRAMQEFNKPVTSLDGGRQPTVTTPAAPKTSALKPQDAKNAWDQGSALLEQRIANLPPAAQKIARDRFFSDPRIAQLRVASARQAPPAQQQARIQQSAQARSTQNVAKSGNFLTALKAGLTRGAFGLPERLAAAGERFLPSAITGNDTDASYDQILDTIRSNTDADLNQNLAGNIIGQATSGGLIGGAVAKSLGALASGTRLGSAAEAVAQAAPRLSKVAAASGAGAVGGAAQSAGEGSDVGTGATFGAIGAPAVMGLGKAAGYLLRPVGDMLGLPSAGKILRRFTTADTDEISRAADEYRRTTGAEPTLYELLPLADRNKLAKDIIGRSPVNSERAAAAVRQRVSNVGPEMAQTVQNSTSARRAQIIGQMQQDLQTARAGNAAPGDAAMASRAAESPVDLENLRATEAGATMGPVDGAHVADTLQDLFPRALRRDPETGDISEVHSDPEMNSLLTRAAGSLRLRLSPDDPSAAVAGLTVNDITRLIDKLGDVHPASPDFMTAERAVNHLLDEMPPEARALTDQMRAAYAGRSRMMEGMAEGARTRTRESVPVENRGQAQTVTNAFDTPEGGSGRFLGQTNALGRQFAGTPDDVLRTAGQVADSGQTQAALRGNLGPDAANAISGAAEAQARSVRNLAAVGKESSQQADSLDLQDLGRLVLALNPAAMPTTKLFALSRLTTLTRLPEGKARQLIDMMFSQDPAMTNRAIAMLNGAGEQGRAFLADIGKSLNVGARAGQVGQTATDDQGGIIPQANAAEPGDIDMSDIQDTPGMLEPGNIDLHNRPVIHNPDGTISTVRSISVGFDDGTYLIPTAIDGKIVSDEEAIAHFKKTHEHLGKFESSEAADAYAQSLHEDQAAEYGDQGDNGDVPYGHQVIQEIFPDAHITSDHRGPDNDIYDPNSGHAGYNTVDVRPIPGMTYEEFLQEIRDAGHEVVKAYDESQRPADPRKAKAWGPHWHVEIA